MDYDGAVKMGRAAACWRIQDCGSCLHSKHGCGWCPVSSTCVPSTNLLDPISKADICPLRSERFELRTKALGCNCSTTTLLSVIVTVFVTIAALGLVYAIFAAIRDVHPFLGTGNFEGTELEIKEDGTRVEKSWWRDSWRKWIYRVFARPDLNHGSEQEVRTERARLLGW
ncbi:hypothetical protein CLAFUW4_07420 [Fulvia fulva]|uniref:PSI domain-containing protein n=1 Tax=Passalora fulva TaxID=5499 RepID=A0A9Q8PA31_PASFU|nr:uncharacterized protein CLAFUR5_07550 [Fulvia fulva]KAK4621852.1 hypothetical protein CLAFUR4_07427 [Fulvia fulva]KAK4623509.1 hypothetical protein CLAFUR0_07426 [Fulvia fulva]UJO18678.1 hypothetical protein CLAFUR5_07550 [Fulvia fulva]WPV16713.1 hypothetical protein CLAFUW4_07420 [Fulvia fulva]WPV30626.1 hypothetical protein CLAFUW7_07423 [Fulvia fulva]